METVVTNSWNKIGLDQINFGETRLSSDRLKWVKLLVLLYRAKVIDSHWFTTPLTFNPAVCVQVFALCWKVVTAAVKLFKSLKSSFLMLKTKPTENTMLGDFSGVHDATAAETVSCATTNFEVQQTDGSTAFDKLDLALQVYCISPNGNVKTPEIQGKLNHRSGEICVDIMVNRFDGKTWLPAVTFNDAVVSHTSVTEKGVVDVSQITDGKWHQIHSWDWFNTANVWDEYELNKTINLRYVRDAKMRFTYRYRFYYYDVGHYSDDESWYSCPGTRVWMQPSMEITN